MNINYKNDFINTFITNRKKSMFKADIDKYSDVLINKIKDKSVLVIGGAGTIGSSFIKAVLKFKPNKLVVVDTNENGLTELTRDLRSENKQFIPKDFLTYPMNFGDKVFEKMFLDLGPFNIVANFAAHKHVRSEKDIYSIESMIENNVFKAKKFLDLLLTNKPDNFFCVSTDKAANPVNVMGASKKIMEEVILSYSSKINITTARFANVAFSNGSLLAGFLERINKDQPISCPNDVKRFFVSPEESGQICMLACLLGKTGEIFFPKLGADNLVSFKKITEDFFKYLNIKTYECSSENEAKKISKERTNNDPFPVFYFKSNTSGEKLFEEFYTVSDDIDINSYTSLGVIKKSSNISSFSLEDLENEFKDVLSNGRFKKSDIIDILKKYLSNFNHIETGKNLDQKM
jgi:FlaA1/EpsC-like NDP-sugar epimerase